MISGRTNKDGTPRKRKKDYLNSEEIFYMKNVKQFKRMEVAG